MRLFFSFMILGLLFMLQPLLAQCSDCDEKRKLTSRHEYAAAQAMTGKSDQVMVRLTIRSLNDLKEGLLADPAAGDISKALMYARIDDIYGASKSLRIGQHVLIPRDRRHLPITRAFTEGALVFRPVGTSALQVLQKGGEGALRAGKLDVALDLLAMLEVDMTELPIYSVAIDGSEPFAYFHQWAVDLRNPDRKEQAIQEIDETYFSMDSLPKTEPQRSDVFDVLSRSFRHPEYQQQVVEIDMIRRAIEGQLRIDARQLKTNTCQEIAYWVGKAQ